MWVLGWSLQLESSGAKFGMECRLSFKSILSLYLVMFSWIECLINWIFVSTCFPFFIRLRELSWESWWINFIWKTGSFSWNFESKLFSLFRGKSPCSVQFIFADIYLSFWQEIHTNGIFLIVRSFNLGKLWTTIICEVKGMPWSRAFIDREECIHVIIIM